MIGWTLVSMYARTFLTIAFSSSVRSAQVKHKLQRAWKLAMVLRGQAGPALLASFEQERRPVEREGDMVVARRRDGKIIARLQSDGPYRSAADQFADRDLTRGAPQSSRR